MYLIILLYFNQLMMLVREVCQHYNGCLIPLEDDKRMEKKQNY